MQFIQRNTVPSFIVTGLLAGVIGLAATSMTMAAGSSTGVSSNSAAGAGTNGGNASDSRMAPTQNTTGTGNTPKTNINGPATDNAMSGNTMSGNRMSSGQTPLQPTGDGETQDSPEQTRMAPTQNTTGTGANPDANN